MLDDLEQKIKEKLLEDLITKMSDSNGDRIKPKGLAVQVAAPDKEKLAEGLDKAKSVLGSVPDSGDMPSGDGITSDPSDDDSDEARLMQLLSSEDDDDEDDKLGMR